MLKKVMNLGCLLLEECQAVVSYCSKMILEDDKELKETFDDIMVDEVEHIQKLTLELTKVIESKDEITDNNKEDEADDIQASACFIIKDGKILCGKRKDDGTICGPGGHIEDGETPVEACIREAIEEFDVVPNNLIPLGVIKPNNDEFLNSMVYVAQSYDGTPETDEEEMTDCNFYSLEELQGMNLFPAFKKSIDMLVNELNENEDCGANNTESR